MAYGAMDVEGHLRTIFRRCVQCPPGPPSCPTCAKDETCSMKAESCTSCASTVCVRIGSIPGQAEQKHSSSVGAIAGGVIGGVAFVVLLTYLVWRFCIRNRRKQWDEQVWTDEADEKIDKRDLHLDPRQSTVGSIASTVLTRASNVIQIAYIPGVTNRSPPESPGLLVPPVPPLPLPTTDSSAASKPQFDQDRHFFLPGDLRDSTYSGFSDDTRHSLTPSLARASVATTIYRNNAVVDPVPAQQALRGKAAVVSVRPGTSGSQTPQTTTTPPVPQLSRGLGSSSSSIVARNLVPKPIEVRKGKLRVGSSSKSEGLRSTSKQRDDSILEENLSEEERSSDGKPHHQSVAATLIDDSPISPIPKKNSLNTINTGTSSSVSAVTPARSPPRDASQDGPSHRHTKSGGGLNSMIEEAMNRAAREPTHGGLGSLPEHKKKDSGPFSDANELKENI